MTPGSGRSWPAPDELAHAPSVFLFRADLDAARVRLPVLERRLSPDERARGARMALPVPRERFLAGRALLRELLAHCVGERPEAVNFAAGEGGKPFLPAHPAWHFSLSHCEHEVLIALSFGHPIGLDIERVREIPQLSGLADRALCLNEHPVEEPREFLRLWTRKEAFLKARGDGLHFAPAHVDVADATGEPRVWDTACEWQQCSTWRLRSFRLSPNLIGALALAAPRRDWPLVWHRFD